MLKRHCFIKLQAVLPVLSFLLLTAVSAQDWRILQNAQMLFDKGDYGDAIYQVKQAVLTREKYTDTAMATLNTALNPAEVRKAGDRIDDVIPVLQKRQTTDALKIVTGLIEKKGSAFFNGSIKKLSDYVKNSRAYPEADFLYGRIYQVEGEYTLAMQYYDSAYKNAFYLDIPDQRYDILYQMADLSLHEENTDNYEKYLLEILKTDTSFSDSTLIDAMERTIALNTEKSLEKFFSLYRAESPKSMKACFMLADLYTKKGRNDKALRMSALGVLIGFTRMYSVAASHDIEFSYTTIKNFLADLKKYPELIEWSREQNYWNGMNSFAEICNTCGYTVFSDALYHTLAEASPEDYWKKEAAEHIRKSAAVSVSY